MSLENAVMKKEDMESGKVYLLCPDKECTLFSEERFPTYRCEHECPRNDEQLLMFLCDHCGNPVDVPGRHSAFKAIYSHTCPDGVNIRHLLPRSLPHVAPIKIYEIPK